MNPPMLKIELPVELLFGERVQYLERTAEEVRRQLESFTGGPVAYDSTALQALDEWIERRTRRGPLSPGERVQIIAFVGQMFLKRHGGFWAVREERGRRSLGVVCPLVGSSRHLQFIDLTRQVHRRLKEGITASLTFFYLTTSVDLQGQTVSE